MEPVVLNTDVRQRDADRSVVVAVSSHAIFESVTVDEPTEDVYGEGVCFPFMQALQRVNERLLERDPEETLLFDVILLCKDSEERRARVIASTKHYGLEISRFCFCSEEDSMEILLSNKVQLFLSTDKTEVSKALERGVAAAMLYQQTEQQSSEQLKLLFSGDIIGPPSDSNPSQDSVREFVHLLGEMRSKFGVYNSPLNTGLLTVWGSRDTCAGALKTLRAWGLAVDEAYSLAGAPRGPIISLLKPHVIFTDDLYASSPASIQEE
ncbi:cytosolic 5'-nucleotidase 1A [Lampris incognitus]|uniref:cytosolic 5'-nucleotidase 1A n=1 Tax=Lampris incognitus TaxID=2546036 RepID=UPI0024B51023|nr:cytosolic 5'-nucleotidase 1A [Lampris incognitus]